MIVLNSAEAWHGHEAWRNRAAQATPGCILAGIVSNWPLRVPCHRHPWIFCASPRSDGPDRLFVVVGLKSRSISRRSDCQFSFTCGSRSPPGVLSMLGPGRGACGRRRVALRAAFVVLLSGVLGTGCRGPRPWWSCLRARRHAPDSPSLRHEDAPPLFQAVRLFALLVLPSLVISVARQYTRSLRRQLKVNCDTPRKWSINDVTCVCGSSRRSGGIDRIEGDYSPRSRSRAMIPPGGGDAPSDAAFLIWSQTGLSTAVTSVSRLTTAFGALT